MSRYESPVQVVALFLMAALLSVGVIYLITAEQQSRMKHSSRGADASVLQSPPPTYEEHTFLFTIQKGLSRVLNFFHNQTAPTAHYRLKRDSPSAKLSDRPESPANQASNFHRIRHALKKLDGGGLEGDVVYRMIFDSIPPQAPKPERKKVIDLQPWEFDLSEPLSLKPTPHPTPFAAEDYRFIESEAEREEKAEVISEETENFEVAGQPLSVSSSPQLVPANNVTRDQPNISPVKRSALAVDVCYGTDDVLVVIGITCSLNFAFVLLIWACVRWFSNSKEKDFQTMCLDGDEGGGGSGEEEDDFWLSTSGNGGSRSIKHSFNPNQTTSTTSLYTIRRESPPETLRKSHSFSMEDLRYATST